MNNQNVKYVMKNEPMPDLNNLHRKQLNKIHRLKTADAQYVQQLKGSDFYTLLQLVQYHYVVPDPDAPDNHILSISGEQARDYLNKKHFETYVPIVLTAISVTISGVALALQAIALILQHINM